jgi:hypothetical protein
MSDPARREKNRNRQVIALACQSWHTQAAIVDSSTSGSILFRKQKNVAQMAHTIAAA